jgi:hypothetical protein
MGKRLTGAQVERYQQDGILFPVPVLSPPRIFTNVTVSREKRQCRWACS